MLLSYVDSRNNFMDDIHKYSYKLCLFIFLETIIFGELTIISSKERMTKNTVFAGATSIN